MMELHCAVQKYSWGKIGKSSLVAQLSSSNPSVQICESDPYAELWMGTHPSGPSIVATTGELLLDYLKANSCVLGNKEKEKFGNDLSFLFKSLSVAKALSIQAHPNKEHAEELFKTRPDLYKDGNHKPEMVVAWLGPFHALCGFRPIQEIKHFLQDIEELRVVIGQNNVDELVNASTDLDGRNALKNCFSALMSCSDEIVAKQLLLFERRVTLLDEENKDKLLVDLFKRISNDFPGDVGCWCIYFMNYVVLEAGESMFLGPNVPHAYIYGDCLECMACSDNVVRAGLTPKFKDIETLCSMLDYEPGTADRFKVQWIKESDICEVCRPPVPDFALARMNLTRSNEMYTLPVRPNASILIILQGQAELIGLGSFSTGQVVFLKAQQQVTIQTQSLENVILYQAFSNV